MKAITQAARRVLRTIPNILIIGLMAFLPHPVLASQAPEIERGLTWLNQQVQADGTLAGEEASVATPYQVRTETHGTLKRLATVPAALTAAITSAEEGTTEHLARGILTRVEAGQDTSVAITRLSARRNADGGYGGDLGFASNPLDTAWTLLAYRAAGVDGDVAGALAYLQGAQGDDGAYHIEGKPDVYVTAVVLQALRAHASRYELSLQTGRASGYLQSLQDADGTWEGDIGLTAQVYLALHDFITLEPLASRVRGALVAMQLSNGSWAGDAFFTALALRALDTSYLQPTPPTKAAVKGAVLDAQTLASLSGVTVVLSNTNRVISLVTGLSGFEFNDLEPDTYTLELTKNGYSAISAQITLASGQLLDLGVLRMTGVVGSSSGSVSGTIRDALNNQPIPDVTVMVVGMALHATTNASGSYRIDDVPPGTVEVRAEKPGYTTAAGTGNVLAGGQLLFSPYMGLGSATQTGIAGRISEALSGVGLSGATVTLAGSNTGTTTTDAEGYYQFQGLLPGNVSVAIAKSGYQESTGTLTVVDGATIFFSIALAKSTDPVSDPTRITGTVHDAVTDQPLSGVTVQSAGDTFVTGDDGRFRVLKSGGVIFTKNGYVGGTLTYESASPALWNNSDLGIIRLLRENFEGALLPDLVVMGVNTDALGTDKQTLLTSGVVKISVANFGTTPTDRVATLKLFEDTNGDGVVSPSDRELGAGVVESAISPDGQTFTTDIVVGEFARSFRNSRLLALVDSDDRIAEIRENNNLAQSSCMKPFPFVDDFNDGVYDGWTAIEGNSSDVRQIENGVLVVYPKSSFSAHWTGDLNWTDYTAEVRVRFPNGANNDAGIQYRQLGAQIHSGDTFRIKAHHARLVHAGNAVAEAPFQVNANQWYQLRTEVTGNRVRAFIDNQLIFDYVGSFNERGAVGLQEDGGVKVEYDDLRVFGPSSPGMADVSLAKLSVLDKGSAGIDFTVIAGNGGGQAVPAGTKIGFYTVPPEMGGLPLVVHVLDQALPPGQFKLITQSFQGSLAGVSEIVGIADAEALLTECDELNNRVTLAMTPGSIEVNLGLNIGTDQSSYPANSPALVTATISNPGQYQGSATIDIHIETADGDRVADLTTGSSLTVQPAAEKKLEHTWNTGNHYAGNYVVMAILRNTQGRELARKTAPFSIVGGPAVLATQLVTDKSAYAQDETVRITGRVVNTSGNRLLGGLRLNETLLRPDGVSLDLGTRALPELAPGIASEQVFTHRLNPAPVGSYTVTQTVLDATGMVLDSRQTRFEVRSGALTGAGLTGTLAASPHEVALGAQVSFTYSLSNQGNAALNALPVSVRVLNPAAQSLVADYPQTLDLAVGGGHAGNVTWKAIGRNGDTLVAALVASVAGTERILAQDSLTLTGSPTLVDLSQSIDPAARVLVLAACAGRGEGHESDHRSDKERRDARNNSPVKRGGCHTCNRDCDDDGDGHDDDDGHGGHCGLGRAQAIDALLDGLGIAHRVTTDPALFRAELRSGAYTVYWLSGRVDKLRDDLAEEVREAVYRGEGLILDGSHDARNTLLDAVAGIRINGKLGQRNQTVFLQAPVFDPLNLVSLGRSLKFQATTGQVLGRFGRLDGYPAVVGNTYGHGRSLFYGFDLVASLEVNAPWPLATAQGVQATQPPVPDVHAAGAWVPIATRVENQGAAADLEVRVTLPAGAAYVSADPEPASVTPANPSVVTWRFALAESAIQGLNLAIRLPGTTGVHTLSSEIGSLEGGVYTPLGDALLLPLRVDAASGALESIRRDLASLPVSKRERSSRDRAVDAVARAQAEFAKGRWDTAIDWLLEAVDKLSGITSLDTGPYRLDLDQALKEAQYRWAVANAH